MKHNHSSILSVNESFPGESVNLKGKTVTPHVEPPTRIASHHFTHTLVNLTLNSVYRHRRFPELVYFLSNFCETQQFLLFHREMPIFRGERSRQFFWDTEQRMRVNWRLLICWCFNTLPQGYLEKGSTILRSVSDYRRASNMQARDHEKSRER